MPEVLVNGVGSTLASAITDSQTTIPIQTADAAKFPASGTYRIAVTDTFSTEIMTVTGGQGTANLTVTRSSEPYGGGLIAYAFVSGATVAQVLTNQGLSKLIGQSGGGSVADQPPASPSALDEEMEGPLNAAWSFVVNSGTLTNAKLGSWVDTNPANPTYNVGLDFPGALVLQPTVGGTICMSRATGFTAGTPWMVACKVMLANTNNTDDRFKFHISPSAFATGSDEAVTGAFHVEFRRPGGYANVIWELRSYGAGQSTGSWSYFNSLAYFAITGNTDNSIRLWVSTDGLGWTWMRTLTGQTVNTTPAYVVLTVKDDGTAPPLIAVVDWVRFKSGSNNLWDLGAGR